MAVMGGVGVAAEEVVKGAEMLGEHIPKPRITLKTPQTEENLPDAVPVPPAPEQPGPDPEDAPTRPVTSQGPSRMGQAGHWVLRNAFPEMYSGVSRGKKMIGDILEILQTENAELIKEREAEVKQDAQYRRDVNELRFDLSSTNAILKNNGELLRQQLVVQTRSLDLLKEILSATGSGGGESGGGGGGGFGLSALTGIVQGLIKNPRLAVLGGVLTALASIATGVIMAKREAPKTPDSKEVSPEVAPSLVPSPESVPYSPINYSPDTDAAKQPDNIVTLRASELKYIADVLTFEANKFSFDSGTGGGGGAETEASGGMISKASLTTNGGGDSAPTPPGSGAGATPDTQPQDNQQGASPSSRPPLIGPRSGGADGPTPQAQAPKAPTLEPEQQTAIDALKSGPVSADSPQAAALMKMTPKELSGAGVSRTGEGKASQFSFSKGAESVSKEDAAASLSAGGDYKSLPAINKKTGSGTKEYESFAMNFFKSKGYSAEEAAHIMGNVQQESGFDPNSRNPNDAGPGLDSVGIGQWNKQRLVNMQSFAESQFGKKYEQLTTQQKFTAQLGYLDHELHTPAYSGALKALKTGQFGKYGHYYEGYGDSSEGTRLGYGQKILDKEKRGEYKVAATPGSLTPEQITAEQAKLSGEKNVETTKQAMLSGNKQAASTEPLHDRKPLSAANFPPKIPRSDNQAMSFPDMKRMPDQEQPAAPQGSANAPEAVKLPDAPTASLTATPSITNTGTPTPLIRSATQVQTPTVRAPTVPHIETPNPARAIDKSIPASYHTPTGVKPGDTSVAALNVHARPPGLSANYYSYLYPHLYGDKAQMSPETQARTA